MSISDRPLGGFTANIYLYVRCVPGLGGFARNASLFFVEWETVRPPAIAFKGQLSENRGKCFLEC